MELFDALQNRRSIRRFTEKTVSDEEIIKLIEAGTLAPSAHNKQPWGFVVVREKAVLQEIADNSKYAKFLPQASAAIIVCAEFIYQRKLQEDKGVEYYSIQDSAAAIQNILLAAYGLRLGSCWIGDFNEQLLRTILNIPSDSYVVGIIAIGYPESDIPPNMPPRKNLEEVIHWEQWN